MHLLILFCTLLIVFTIHCYVNSIRKDIKLIKMHCLEIPFGCDDACDYL